MQLGILESMLRILADGSRNVTLVFTVIDALRKLIRSSLKARADLKGMGAVKMVEALRFQYSSEAKVTRAANDFLHDIESATVVTRMRSNNKAIASTHDFKLPDLDQNIRLFLCAGGVLTKYCKTAAPRRRQVFVSTDLRFLVWKESNKKPRSFFCDNIQKIAQGRSTPELQRESMLFSPANEFLSFAVMMKDGRRLSLEATTPELREQWIRCLDALLAYRQALTRLTVKSDDDPVFDESKEEISLFE